MKIFNKVRGTMDIIPSILVGVDTVYARSNIIRIETDEFKGWEYDEIQYGKDEYIENLAEKKMTDQLKVSSEIVQQYLNLVPPVENPIILDDYKQNKIYELNTACNQDILNGFTSSCTGVEHQYKFDMEYQGNFAQQGVMLSLDPTIETVPWPTNDEGVVDHTRESFIQLCKEAQDWKSTNIYRYFGMKAQVMNCTLVDELNVIVW